LSKTSFAGRGLLRARENGQIVSNLQPTNQPTILKRTKNVERKQQTKKVFFVAR
jgi:hypothetical protein